ncbi:zinc ribbon domain-containing protein [Vibrio mytili]|uniref:Zinc-ribbon domain-containing protein n=1 Tax=Vibrio mytili TaxID=50718 RepID=A0A0C3HM49_9VIBR|nr:zinc ribbon domain-containing protein [Vibrio mytili]KIN09211.1 hypothetical protein SU60_20595 [Vibrio mytili]
MYCKKCGNEVEETDHFCSKCGSKLSGESQSASGDGSVNIAGANKIDNSNIHIGDIYENSPDGETAYIDRTYVKRFELAGSQVKASWFTFSGAVGFLGSLASIFSLWATNWQYVGLLIFALSFSLLMFGLTLKRIRFVRLPITKYNLEANVDGLVFITKVEGACPKCDGKLELVDIKVAQDTTKTFVRCNRYGKHIWEFDPTVLK